MVDVVWFKRDLRVSDHPALAHAAGGPCVALYILEPDWWAEPDMSARQFAFLQESLEDLRGALAEKGLGLTVRVGAAVEVLSGLRREVGFARLISHEETGGDWTYRRDRAVGAWCRAEGVDWLQFAQSGVVRRLQTRDAWSAKRNAWLRKDLAVVCRMSGPALTSDDIPRLFPSAACAQRQEGGRQAGLALLESFLAERGRTYRKDMSSPLTGERACSRLSPHLAWGTLSGREAAQRASGRSKAYGWAGPVKSFQARLAWRDHFMQKLEDEPALEYRCLHSAYEGLRGDDAVRREAWEKGETGIPFVDACMRYLNATGWLNFRMRSMLMAVASYHLWLDWRKTGLHLARAFTDYEPGIHWPQVQMQSGTTGMNTVRIYNPVKQGKDQDPQGLFTRQWVPELCKVPDTLLQTPWAWEGRLDYPRPVVDVTEAARLAREKVWARRKGQAFRQEAASVIQKHASRKDSQGHFVNDRAPRTKRNPTPKDDPRQRGFEF